MTNKNGRFYSAFLYVLSWQADAGSFAPLRSLAPDMVSNTQPASYVDTASVGRSDGPEEGRKERASLARIRSGNITGHALWLLAGHPAR